MSMSANLHRPTTVSVSDLYEERPGDTISVQVRDDSHNEFTMFFNDASLRKLAIALKGYAAVRENPPVAPKPTYAETLFAPVDTDTDLPF